MKDTYLNVKLIEPDLIRLVVFSSLPWERIEPVLVVDGVAGNKMTPTRLNTLSSLAIADFRLEKPLELGHSYFLRMPQYGFVALDVTEATGFPGFDEKFFYAGDDLGFVYSKKKTRFALWAPLASKVVLSYRDQGEKEFRPLVLTRGEKGVFRGEIAGDHEGAEYRYFVTNSEVTVQVTDPYAKASTPNGENSVVVDFGKLKINTHREGLPILQSPTESIIYETHVRDFTIDPHTTIEHKGKYLGMVEKGAKTKKGHPAGLDYLLGLGITHVQLLPIYDYKTVDELRPDEKYNWGYDPAQYFVPEGSYASDPKDPYSRIRDCKKMISEFHKAGLRVVMDVVYNHVFEYEGSVFERVVPNYYFRHKSSGKMANTSGCGDDVASERPMVRKLIVDACKHWINEYDIDGFRFDLMGILDVDTLNEIARVAKAKDRSFLLYGEGWNMGGEVKIPLGHMDNYRLLPEYGFFNDFFRENLKRFFVEDRGVVNSVKNALVGSCTDYFVPARFLNANQTINYVECHDNGTYFDVLSKWRSDLSEEEKLKLCLSAALSVIFSIGIPLLHMGQEIGLTKFGEENSYNKGDLFNKMDYALLDKRYDMVEEVSKAIKLRKKLRSFHIFDPRVIGPSMTVDEKEEALILRFVDSNLTAPYKNLNFVMNPTGREIALPELQNAEILFGKPNERGIPGRSVLLFACK